MARAMEEDMSRAPTLVNIPRTHAICATTELLARGSSGAWSVDGWRGADAHDDDGDEGEEKSRRISV